MRGIYSMVRVDSAEMLFSLRKTSRGWRNRIPWTKKSKGSTGSRANK